MAEQYIDLNRDDREYRVVNKNESDDQCTRCIRKKFKCIMLFLLAIITVTQLLDTIFSKLENYSIEPIVKIFSTIYEKNSNKTSFY